jgi:hypothetical protein
MLQSGGRVKPFLRFLITIFGEKITYNFGHWHWGAQNLSGMILFTLAALLSLHSGLFRFIAPSPPNRPASIDRRSETGTVRRPTQQMDPLTALSSSTLESSAEGRCCRESKLDPRPSCGGR